MYLARCRRAAPLVTLCATLALCGWLPSSSTADPTKVLTQTTEAPPVTKPPSKLARVLERLKSGKQLRADELKLLKRLDRRQTAALERRTAQIGKRSGTARASTQGTYYHSTSAWALPIYYDLYYDFTFSSSSYYYFHWYRNWKVCSVDIYHEPDFQLYCIPANSYSDYFTVYSYGAWYSFGDWSGGMGPTSG